VLEALEAALAQRDDLDQYGNAKRTLFALQLTLDLEDIHSVAASALTDGPDDKSCDLVYVDRDARSVIVAQGYEAAATTKKQQAPLGKVSSLHQAVNWLFGAQKSEELPERLRSSWNELRDALVDGIVDDVQIWFVHNLPQAPQNAQELTAVAQAADALIRQRYDTTVSVVAVELGNETLADRYEGSRTPILVTDEFVIATDGHFTEQGDNWTALCTTVPASWLYERFQTHRDRLFSANIRGYLGSKRSQSNINNGIQETIRDAPAKFWAYNNGITALVHKFEATPGLPDVRITGIAIVNGAQTTGAIGSTEANGIAQSRLLARFIKCEDAATVREIIRFNNRQNPTQAADFRSNDRVQTKLVTEFGALGVVGYNGGRRGGAEDVIRRPGENQISATVAAQALAAFHGGPAIAYHEKGQIWEVDEIYSTVFPERTTARHIIFVFSLLRAVERQKVDLGQKAEMDRTRDEKELLAWFSLRGSTFLAVAAIGAAVESIVGLAIADKYLLRFNRTLPIQKAVEQWNPVVSAMLALAPDQLSAPLESAGGLRNRAALEASLNTFRSLVGATKKANAAIYSQFAGGVTVGVGSANPTRPS
jgi:hypothetical protein